MMPRKKTPDDPEQNDVTPHDPYRMTSLEQILTLFDGGEFLAEVMQGHEDLMRDLLDHNAEHGPKGCKGAMQISVGYTVGNAGDVGMSATVTFTSPKKPPSSAAAYIDDAGHLTLYSPMMRRMQTPVRDITPHDPETGEVRDAD